MGGEEADVSGFEKCRAKEPTCFVGVKGSRPWYIHVYGEGRTWVVAFKNAKKKGHAATKPCGKCDGTGKIKKKGK